MKVSESPSNPSCPLQLAATLHSIAMPIAICQCSCSCSGTGCVKCTAEQRPLNRVGKWDFQLVGCFGIFVGYLCLQRHFYWILQHTLTAETFAFHLNDTWNNYLRRFSRNIQPYWMKWLQPSRGASSLPQWGCNCNLERPRSALHLWIITRLAACN